MKKKSLTESPSDKNPFGQNRMKSKTRFICNQCAAIFSQWAGQCAQCGAWNAVSEENIVAVGKNSRIGNYANQRSAVTLVEDVVLDCEVRMDCGLSELNRVLGGGLVDGSVVLGYVKEEISQR